MLDSRYLGKVPGYTIPNTKYQIPRINSKYLLIPRTSSPRPAQESISSAAAADGGGRSSNNNDNHHYNYHYHY